MTFTFIQHLLENEPSKESLLEVNTEDFLNVLLAGAGEETLREGELEGIPERMTVGALINMYENRMPPPKMNYNFDEVGADAPDEKSFSRAGAARRKAERSPDYNREMGFRDAENERTRSGRFQGMDAEEEEIKKPKMSRAEKLGYDDARSGRQLRTGQGPAYYRGAERINAT